MMAGFRKYQSTRIKVVLVGSRTTAFPQRTLVRDYQTKRIAANQALYLPKFQLRSYRKAFDSWVIVGLRNRVVKDIRKMIGKMIWVVREQAAYSEKK
jgi:hypothetical protein